MGAFGFSRSLVLETGADEDRLDVAWELIFDPVEPLLFARRVIDLHVCELLFRDANPEDGHLCEVRLATVFALRIQHRVPVDELDLAELGDEPELTLAVLLTSDFRMHTANDPATGNEPHVLEGLLRSPGQHELVLAVHLPDADEVRRRSVAPVADEGEGFIWDELSGLDDSGQFLRTRVVPIDRAYIHFSLLL